MFKIKIFGETDEATKDVNGLVDVSSLVGSSVEIDCSFLNYEPFKVSEKREIAGATFVDDGIYRYGFKVTTDRYLLSNFDTQFLALIPILQSNYLYVQVLIYSFVPYLSTKAMPFIVNDFAVNWNKGYKWFELGMEKTNGKA